MMRYSVPIHLNRREALAGLAASGALAALPGCAATATHLPSTPASGTHPLLDEIAWNLLAHEPASVTGLGLDTGERAHLRGQFGDASQAGIDAVAATLRGDLARVRALDLSALDPVTRTHFEVIESAYSTALDGMALPYGDVSVGGWRNAPYVVIQNVGSYIDVPRFMESDQPLKTAQDELFFISRLAQAPAILQAELDRLRAARAVGVIPPAFLLDKAIAQMENTLGNAASGGSIGASFNERTGRPESGNARRVWALVAMGLAPSYAEQLDELKIQRGMASDQAGMWAQPGGDEWYAWALRASTTTALSAAEIHRMGLAQLEEIHAQMDVILQGLGYTSGSVGERMSALTEDQRFKFPAGDPGRAEIMQFIQQRIDWIRAQMPRAFRTLVNPKLEVRRLPLAEEPGAPTAYGGAGSIDGSIPGKMWINLHTTDLHRSFTLPTLVHHEAIPGHIWQGEYANRMPLIRTRLAFNAFSEGWALYAEQLADELGAYDENPAMRLGYLQDQAFRACRLVVDTGLHAKRWTRAQGVNFFVERNGDNPQEIASEVDRYCSWPGQACGYKVGHSEIIHQRSRAAAALGPAYDLRDFNQAVVQGGNVPLDVLARNVDRYVAPTPG